MIDLTVIIIFHGEGYLAPASIKSYLQCCQRAEGVGISVQKIAVVDKADPLTKEIILAEVKNFHHVEWVDYGDLGLSRNRGTALAKGKHVAFLDGDDLWGSEWLVRAYRLLAESRREMIVHPEVVYYFSAEDYLNQSTSSIPNKGLKSFYFLQVASSDPGFDARTVMFNNIWTANTLARKVTFERFPYQAVDRKDGFGVEDWTWNAQTLASGVEHSIASDTVHCVRLKAEGSLGVKNSTEKIIPKIAAHWEALEHY